MQKMSDVALELLRGILKPEDYLYLINALRERRAQTSADGDDSGTPA